MFGSCSLALALSSWCLVHALQRALLLALSLLSAAFWRLLTALIQVGHIACSEQQGWMVVSTVGIGFGMVCFSSSGSACRLVADLLAVGSVAPTLEVP